MTDIKVLRCGFCGFTQNDVKQLFQGQGGACICNDCILASIELLRAAGMAPPCDVCADRSALRDAGYVETQLSIAEWAEQTFGPAVSPARIAGRANEEMAELLRVATSTTDPRGMIEEATDVVIVLMRLFHRLGVSMHDEVDRKMAINRQRRWERDGSGHGYHRKVDA